MLLKFVPMPEPGLVDRETAVISMKPTGVMKASPIFNCNGAVSSAEPERDCEVAAMGAQVVGGGAAGTGGRMGAVLAISPRLGCAGRGAGADAGEEFESLASNRRRSSSICFC